MCPFEEFIDGGIHMCVYHGECGTRFNEMATCAGNGDAFCYQAIDKAINGTEFDDSVDIKLREAKINEQTNI